MKITMNNRFTKEVITSSLLWGSGDFIAQKIKIKTKTKKRHSEMRRKPPNSLADSQHRPSSRVYRESFRGVCDPG